MPDPERSELGVRCQEIMESGLVRLFRNKLLGFKPPEESGEHVSWLHKERDTWVSYFFVYFDGMFILR